MRLRWTLAGLLLLMTGIAGAQVSGHAVASATGVANATVAATVKNSPFSAEVVTQYDRTLDNAGHIHRETRGKVYRDSQGRMRTDSGTPSLQSGADKVEHVTINDPVQRVIINLNPKTKTATIFHLGQGMGSTAPIAMGNVAGSPVNVAPLQPGLEAGRTEYDSGRQLTRRRCQRGWGHSSGRDQNRSPREQIHRRRQRHWHPYNANH